MGVGAHLQHWGYAPEKIHELDWFEQQRINSESRVHLVPARHYSGRGLTRNKTLWGALCWSLTGAAS
nr:hypothetical protein [Motiliproteus sp. SC1-56]